MRAFVKYIGAGMLPVSLVIGIFGIEAAYPQPETNDLHPALVAAFIDSVGINTSIDGKTTSCADVNVVLNHLKDVGIKYIRDPALQGGIPFDPERYRPILSAGIKMNFNIGDGTNATVPELVSAADRLEQMYPGGIATVEGYNEIDQPNWSVKFNGDAVDAGRGYYTPVLKAQKSIYQLIHGDSVLKNIRVLNFSIAYPKDGNEIDDDSSYADYANVHAYAVDGSPPYKKIPQLIEAVHVTHGLPVIVTETGYPTISLNGKESHDLVDEHVQAVYLADTLLDNFRSHIFRTFIYELIDRRPDPSNTHINWHFGIYRPDGTAKAAAVTIGNMFDILRTDNQITGSTQLQDLTYNLQYRDNDTSCPVSNLLFQKSDKLYAFTYWAEPKIWDGMRLHALPVSGCGNVVLSFPQKVTQIEVFDPTKGRSPVVTTNGQNTISYPVMDHPIIVQVQF